MIEGLPPRQDDPIYLDDESPDAPAWLMWALLAMGVVGVGLAGASVGALYALICG